MIWIYAAAHAAQMIKLQPIWNRPKNQCIKVPVGVSAFDDAIMELIGHHAVSGSINMSIPYPTRRTVSSFFQYKRIREFVRVAKYVVTRIPFGVASSLVRGWTDFSFLAASTSTESTLIHGHLSPKATIAEVGV
jgi:hypothetical protein